MNIDLANVTAFALIALRCTGMFVFNPIIGRRSIPPTINAALALMIAFVITPAMGLRLESEPTFFMFFIMAVKELLVGLIAGFVMQLILSVFVFGGEIIDMQLGLGMAKVFDPATNASVSITSNMFNILFTLSFFIANCHLTLIQMLSQTFDVIPLGFAAVPVELFGHMSMLFSTMILFAVKLCLPIAVVEIIITVAVGLLTRVIPQINVFVVNIQFKLLVGIFSLLVLIPSFVGFMENMLIVCFENINMAWRYLIP